MAPKLARTLVLLGSGLLTVTTAMSTASARTITDYVDERVGELEERLIDAEDRLDVAERHSILDKLTLGVEYRALVNYYRYKGPTDNTWDMDENNAARQIEQNSDDVWTHRGRIHFGARPLANLKFTATLSMFKAWGDDDVIAQQSDFSTDKVPSNNQAFFERFWIDWFVTDWLAVSFGRTAYSDGNPAELQLNSSERRGTWAIILADADIPTLSVTLNFSKLMRDTYLRFIYGSRFADSDWDPNGRSPFLRSDTGTLRTMSLNFDTRLPGIGDNFIQLSYNAIPNFVAGNIPVPDPFYDPNADTYRDPRGQAGQLFPSKYPDSLGATQSISLMLQFYDVADLGLDFFASGVVRHYAPSGDGIEYMLPRDLTNPNDRQSTPFMFMASTGETPWAYQGYAGFRQLLAIEALNNPKFGFEFNYGSKFHVTLGNMKDNLLNKLAVRGKVYDSYLIMPLNERAFFRFTYAFYDYDYDGDFFGPDPKAAGSTAPDSDKTLHYAGMLFFVQF